MEYLQYFNERFGNESSIRVLNLIINGIPSILKEEIECKQHRLQKVLNLIINGIPSILYRQIN